MKENEGLGGQIFIELLYKVPKFYTLSCLILSITVCLLFSYCLDGESGVQLGYILCLNSCRASIRQFFFFAFKTIVFIIKFFGLCRHIFSLFHKGISLAPQGGIGSIQYIWTLVTSPYMPINGKTYNEQNSTSALPGCHLNLWAGFLSVVMPCQTRAQ